MNRRDLIGGLALAASAVAAAPASAAPAGSPGAAGAPLGSDPLDAYRKIFASRSGENVCCWYLGTMFFCPEGVPEIPVLQAETIMVYRAGGTASTGLEVAWTEIGYFRDPATGLPVQDWLNPFTGKAVKAPRSFKDGPGRYLLEPRAGGLGVKLLQTGAVVESVDLSMTRQGDRIHLQQVERKVRGVGAGKTAEELARMPRSVTTLSLWADAAEVADPARPGAAASGSYSFETAGLPAWSGLQDRPGRTMVRGAMRKTSTTDALNPGAWKILREIYPDFFDAQGVAPRW